MADKERLNKALETLKMYGTFQPGQDGFAAVQVIEQELKTVPPDNSAYSRKYTFPCMFGHAELSIPAPGNKFCPDDADDLIYWLESVIRQLERARPEKPAGDPLTTFTWLDEAKFVSDGEGGHIEFADKVWRPVKPMADIVG